MPAAGCSSKPSCRSNRLPPGLPAGRKADNQILAVVRALEQQFPDRPVVLVSKDINMRIKARALGLPAEEYFNDHVLEDTDLLYSGIIATAGRLLEQAWQGHGILAGKQARHRLHLLQYDRPTGARTCWSTSLSFMEPNNGEASFYGHVKQINGKTAR
jgi:PhoH-like ATPase